MSRGVAGQSARGSIAAATIPIRSGFSVCSHLGGGRGSGERFRRRGESRIAEAEVSKEFGTGGAGVARSLGGEHTGKGRGGVGDSEVGEASIDIGKGQGTEAWVETRAWSSAGALAGQRPWRCSSSTAEAMAMSRRCTERELGEVPTGLVHSDLGRSAKAHLPSIRNILRVLWSEQGKTLSESWPRLGLSEKAPPTPQLRRSFAETVMAGGGGQRSDWRGRGGDFGKGRGAWMEHGGGSWPEQNMFGGPPGFQGPYAEQPQHPGFQGGGPPGFQVAYADQPQQQPGFQGFQAPQQFQGYQAQGMPPTQDWQQFQYGRGQTQRPVGLQTQRQGGGSSMSGEGRRGDNLQSNSNQGQGNVPIGAAKQNSSGSSGSFQAGGQAAVQSVLVTEKSAAIGSKPADLNESVGVKQACHRCTKTGHFMKDCKEELFCINCGKEDAHVSGKCFMVNRPSPVVKLVGCAAEGLQMLVASSGRKTDKEGPKETWGLATVLEGELNVNQLTAAFKKQFPWGGDWQVKEHGKKTMLVKFSSAQRLEEMNEYPYFGLKGSNNVVKIRKWNPAADAFFKMSVVWVRATNVQQYYLLQHT